MQIARTMTARRRAGPGGALSAAVVIGAALLLGACNTDQQITGAPSEPTDYRLRHPITITEGSRTFEIFVGSNRGSLTPSQRAELMAFAESWSRDATGGVIIDVPVGNSNERAAAEALPEVRSILAASGVPPTSIAVQSYRPAPNKLATIRVVYPKIVAQAGPCGIWPKDIGPSMNRDYFENQPAWNMGCATQRNLAAEIDNPADLVQPRAETPAYTMKRTTSMEKYRAGTTPATVYSNTSTTQGSITNIGQ